MYKSEKLERKLQAFIGAAAGTSPMSKHACGMVRNMPYISRKSRRYIFTFIGALVIACLIQILPMDIFMLKNLSSIVYMGIVIAWIITVQRRVTFSYIKGYLVLGGFSAGSLFLLRLMRWSYFEEVLTVNRITWYSYYIPITIIPLLSLLLALKIGKDSRNDKPAITAEPSGVLKPQKYSAWTDYLLIISWIVLIVLVMTNDLHGWVFRIELFNEMRKEYTYGPGFFVIITWCIILTVLSMVFMVKRSRSSSARYLAWIPEGVCAFFSLFLLIYIVNGGNALQLFDHAAYNFQEVYALMFIGMWEASLRIGLIPSNSDYDDIFKLANIKAAIADDDYNLRYLSNDATLFENKQVKQALESNGVKLDENRKLKAHKLKAGCVLWVEDHSMVNDLNQSLQEAIDRISEENSLLEIENEIKSQKQAIEVRNKLYDSISNRTKIQLEKIENILERTELSGADPFEAIKQCVVLGAYVKRQANLSILSEQYKKLKLEELRFAIRESLENIRLLGVDANVSGIRADTEFDGRLLVFAYEIFEATIEAALPKAETISCILNGEDGIGLEILMDTPTALPDFKKYHPEQYGATIDVLHEEEGIYVRFTSEEREVEQ